MRRMKRCGWAIALALALLASPTAKADPISYLAGSVYRFTMTSTGAQGHMDGQINVSLSFGSADASFINSGGVSPLSASFGQMNFTAYPNAYPNPPGGPAGQVLYPVNFNGGFSIAFPTGTADFTANVTMGSIMMDVLSDPNGGGVGVSLNPFPALPPGPSGLTLLGTVVADQNGSEEDLSLFGPDSGGIFSLVLLADDPNFNFEQFMQVGGNVEGTGAFMQIGGVPGGGGGSEVPEPFSLLAFGGAASVGLYVARRQRRQAKK